MSLTGLQIVDAVVSQGSFDTSSSGLARTDVAGWCGEVYACLVAEAQWLRAITTFATTVADENEYDWPSDVVAAVELRDQAGRRYQPVTIEQMWDLEGADLLLTADAPAVYAVTYDSSGGARNMRIYPTPTDAGLVLEGLCTLYPPAFQDDSGFTPVTPADFDGAIIDGAIRVGRRRTEETDDPVVLDQLLAGEIGRLRVRRLAEVPPPETLPVRLR